MTTDGRASRPLSPAPAAGREAHAAGLAQTPVRGGAGTSAVPDGPATAGFDGPIVTAVNDQHAYLSVPADQPLAVGDLVAFWISHPCTTFDKWRAIPVVDESYRMVEIAHTRF